jgi:hypothetical protein
MNETGISLCITKQVEEIVCENAVGIDEISEM